MGDGSADAPGGDRDRGDTEVPTLLGRPPSLHPGPRRVGERGNAGAKDSTARSSPAGEEMKQRVLLLLSARRHGRRSPPQPLEGRLEVSGSAGLAALPQAAADAPMSELARGRPRRPAPSAAWRPASQRPRRRFPAASQSPARGRHVAEAGP